MEIICILIVLGIVGALIEFISQHKVGCVVVVLLVLLCGVAYFAYQSIREEKEAKAREERERLAWELKRRQEEATQRMRLQEEQAKFRLAEQKRQDELRRKCEKEEEIRAFAIKENPALWSDYQALGGSISEQIRLVENLRKKLVDFGKDPQSHSGYQKVCEVLRKMQSTHDEIRQKLEEAYFESLSFDALPERGKERANGCLKEAEAVFNRYKILSEEKSNSRGILDPAARESEKGNVNE